MTSDLLAPLRLGVLLVSCAALFACSPQAEAPKGAATATESAQVEGVPATSEASDVLADEDMLSAFPGVLIVCDARAGLMTAARLDTAEALAAAMATVADPGDPLIHAALFAPDDGYGLRNSRAERENPDATPEGGRELVALEQRPLRVFCTAETLEAFASADMTVSRAPNNFNPNGRCGAASLLSLEVRHNDADPVTFDLIGDCHSEGPYTSRVEVNLFTAGITAEADAVEGEVSQP
jgi:hypothetical protein